MGARTRTLGSALLVLTGGAATAAACAAVSPSRFGATGSGATETTTASASGSGGGSASAGAGLGGGVAFDAGIVKPCMVTDPNVDMDGDGWTPAEGDCNDCDPNVNPGAIDVLHAGDDGGAPTWGNEDCANMPGDPQPPCDDGLALDDPDPMNAARTVELCHPFTDPKKWGIKSAKWVLPDGTPTTEVVPDGVTTTTVAEALANYALGHGILPAFGPNVNVQAGKRMLGLSSGTARQPGDPGYRDVRGFDKGYTVRDPRGFPKESPACPGVTTGVPHDAVALEVDLVAPTNATGFAFNFAFFTYEWPGYICSTFNDFFMALLYPVPPGQADGNITFDAMGNPVSVNNAFLEACGCAGGPPCVTGTGADQKTFTCQFGTAPLVGTGFGRDTAGTDHGSTYWLETTAPVTPHQEITLRWAVYDSSDGMLDTTALVDNFHWVAKGAVEVNTMPVPMPK